MKGICNLKISRMSAILVVMKSRNTFPVLFIFFCQTLIAQPQAKIWDKNFGGLQVEIPAWIEQLPDSGYLILSGSTSGSGYDKTDPNRGLTGSGNDYWLIRLDKDGNKVWDKTYGGSGNDAPASFVILPDGYVLAGTSSSNPGSEKSDTLRGVTDFWVIKVDTGGNKIWDKTIGGPLMDQLNGIVLTTDNYLMLAGWTLSGSGGDKVSPSLGDFDYWLVKLDTAGNFIFEKTIGGLLGDNCYALTATTDGGAILTGYSNSPISFNKTQSPRGGFDFWAVRVDSLGRKVWDKTYGGSGDDYSFCISKFLGVSGGYLLGGDSFSGVGNEKTEPSRGADDYWMIRINESGALLWDHTYGGSDYDELNRITVDRYGEILLSGESYSSAGPDKSENNLGAEQIWMIKTDSSGNRNWDKVFFSNGHDEYTQAIQTIDDCYTGLTFTLADTGGYRSFNNIGGGDLWLTKLCFSGTGLDDLVNSRRLTIAPNPANDFIRLTGWESFPVLLSVYNGSGACILNKTVDASEIYINTSKLEAGLYLVVVQGSTVESIKFIKK